MSPMRLDEEALQNPHMVSTTAVAKKRAIQSVRETAKKAARWL